MRKGILAFLCVIVASSICCSVENPSSINPDAKWEVVIIPVSGQVDPGLYRYLSRSLHFKEKSGNILYVLEMDSFGGRVDAAYSCVDTVLKVGHGKTVAYVTTKAISAAAMIALSCEKVYMRKNATLGDCAPIVLTFEGPKEMGEKFQSPLRAKFRTLAKTNGYPLLLSEAMVTKDMEVYSVTIADSSFFTDANGYETVTANNPDSVIDAACRVQKGHLLTMDDEEARLFGFSQKTVTSVEQILNDMNITDFTIHRLQPRGGKGFAWSSLTSLEKMYWYLAIPATVIFVLMVIMTFAGMGEGDAGDGMDADIEVDGDGLEISDDGDFDSDAGDGTFLAAFHFFTFRNLVVFFMMFGWTGISMIRGNASIPVIIGVSFGAGILMMLIISFMFYLVAKLVHSGNVSIKSAVGAHGTVYLTVPANRSGQGKVNVVVEGKKIEYKAMTNGKKILTGESIRVVGLVSNEALLVDKN